MVFRFEYFGWFMGCGAGSLSLSHIYGFEWLVEWWCKSLSWFGGGLGGRCSGVGWFLSIWWWLVSCLDLMDCEIKNFFFFHFTMKEIIKNDFLAFSNTQPNTKKNIFNETN